MRNKKFVALLMAMVMSISLLAGCGGSGGNANTANTGTGTDSTNNESTAPAEGDQVSGDITPITFKFYNEDGTKTDNFQSPVAQKITELTGVTLEVDYPVGGDTQRVATMIAADSYPDLIFAKGSYDQLVQAGALIDLTDLIEQYGPNIKKMYGDEIGKLRYSAEDPSIYSLSNEGVGGPDPNANPDGTFQVQLAVLEDAGYPIIRTLDQLEEILRSYKEKYPTINGHETIPLMLSASDWRWYITLANPSGFAQGHQDDGQWIIDKDGNATYKHTTEGNKEYFRWLNKMYNEGLLDKESFTHSHDEYQAKLSTGAVLATADAWWDFTDSDAVLKQEGMFERLRVGMPVTLDESIKSPARMYQGFTGGWGIGITTSCADPVRAIQFLDFMASDEGVILRDWGIEGINYTVVDNMRVRSAEEIEYSLTNPNYDIETGVGLYNHPFPAYQNGVVSDEYGNTYTKKSQEQQISEYTDEHRKALDAYGITVFAELFPGPEEFELPPWGAAWQTSPTSGSQLEDIINKLNDEISMTTLPKVVIAPVEEFDATWEAYQEAMIAAGVEQANKEFSELLDATMRFWGTK